MPIDIQYIKKNERFPFKFIDLLNGLFLLFPTMLILMSLVMIRSYNMTNMTGINALLAVSIIIGLIGLAFFVFITKRLIQNLQFTKFYTGFSNSKNVEIAENVFHKLYQRQFTDESRIDQGLIVAKSGISFFSWGEINTVICKDNAILINSRPAGQPVTIFENQLNVKRIIKKIEEQMKPSP